MSVESQSIQSQVIAVAVSLLAGAMPFVGAYRTRMAAFDPSTQLPAYNVLPQDGESEYQDNGSIDRKFRFIVRHMAVAVDEVDAAVDAIYVAGQKVLLADPTLGGLVLFTYEISQRWEMEKGELDTVALVVVYESQFSTTRSDPSVSWP